MNMRFLPTTIPKLFIVELEPIADDRGFFARTWGQQEQVQQGLADRCNQVSLAYNKRRGTMRGMHYQLPPHAEAKMVRVIRGAIHDVVLDLRRESSAFGKWLSIELTADNRKAIFIPEGCAHGYLTLTDDAEVLYVISGEHAPQAERGIRWDSPSLQGAWPFTPTILSDRDQRHPCDLSL